MKEQMNKKILVIVESPHKATTIKKYLGDNYTIVASKGHIVDLAKGGRHGMGIDINNNFKPHYIILDDKVETLQMIMDAAKESDEIIICSDADREGEMIGQQISHRLKDFGKPISRAEIHEITKRGVLEGLKNLRDINMNLVRAQEGRRILDRIVGFSASPFLMNYFGSKLSAGRVQSVITRLIIDREQEIQTFKPEEYFTIQAMLAKDIKSFVAKYEGKINNKETAAQIRSELENKLAKYVVVEVNKAEEKKKPFPPLITSKLQQVMSKQYKINSQKTMAAAQNLYESGLITYHRTDSVRISEDATKECRSWLKDNHYDLPKSSNRYKNKNASQNAHEAIRPTNINDTPDTIGLFGDEKQVYEAIWKYFVASQMKEAIYDTLKVVIQVKGTKHKLVASGKALKYKGFLEILGTTDDDTIDIPNLNVGDILVLFGEKPIDMQKKQTQPPPRFSEASLIKTLEDKEIGRPSTYATLLSTITTRGYVEAQNNVFHPTELGKQITEELVKYFSFLEFDYTAKLELALDDIAEGKLDHIQMLKEFYNTFKVELKKAYINHGAKPCKKCDGMLRKITSKKGDVFFGCNRFPNCSYTEKADTVENHQTT